MKTSYQLMIQQVQAQLVVVPFLAWCINLLMLKKRVVMRELECINTHYDQYPQTWRAGV